MFGPSFIFSTVREDKILQFNEYIHYVHKLLKKYGKRITAQYSFIMFGIIYPKSYRQCAVWNTRIRYNINDIRGSLGGADGGFLVMRLASRYQRFGLS
jgi:hypothetical protein